MRTGRNPTLRHVNRTHRVSIQWLHEVCKQPYIDLQYIESAEQAADIFTKAFTEPNKWAMVMKLINHVDEDTFWKAPDEEIVKALAAIVTTSLASDGVKLQSNATDVDELHPLRGGNPSTSGANLP